MFITWLDFLHITHAKYHMSDYICPKRNYLPVTIWFSSSKHTQSTYSGLWTGKTKSRVKKKKKINKNNQKIHQREPCYIFNKARFSTASFGNMWKKEEWACIQGTGILRPACGYNPLLGQNASNPGRQRNRRGQFLASTRRTISRGVWVVVLLRQWGLMDSPRRRKPHLWYTVIWANRIADRRNSKWKGPGASKKMYFWTRKASLAGVRVLSSVCSTHHAYSRTLSSFSSSELFQIGEGARLSNPRWLPKLQHSFGHQGGN